MPQRTLSLDRPLDVVATLGPVNRGPSDPTTRCRDAGQVWRATRTADGPATVSYRIEASRLVVEAWGDGADVGARRRRPSGRARRHGRLGPGMEHPVIARLLVDHPGVGQPRTGAVFEALVGAVLDQRVTSFEAQRGDEQVVQADQRTRTGPGRALAAPRR